MSNRYKIKNQKGLYFLTLTVVGWIDIFSRKSYRDVIIESLDFCQKKKGLRVHGYVIMTNHIHLIVSSVGSQTISEIFKDFKSYTATTILKSLPQSRESRWEWLLYLLVFLQKRIKEKLLINFGKQIIIR